MKQIFFAIAGWAGMIGAVPATIITSFDMNQGNAYTITQTGLYVLSDDVISPGSTAIIISSSNVDLNLNGKTIKPSGGAGVGISVSPGIGNVTIRNGYLTDCQAQGINFAAGTARFNIVIDGVRITRAGTGISVDSCFNLVVQKSEVSFSVANGISLTNSRNVIIDKCTLNKNGTAGCRVATTTALISNCDMNDNVANGLLLPSAADSLVENCRCTANLINGIFVQSGSSQTTIRNCFCCGNGSAGFRNDSTTSGVIGCIAFMNTVTNYAGTAPLSAISVNRFSQLAPGSVTDQRYDNLDIV